MDLLDDFFKKNDVRIGKDFEVKPAIHYLSLHDAFHNYFISGRSLKSTFHFIYSKEKQNRKNLSYNYSGDSKAVSMSLLGFHRFIELHLKHILYKVNPLLTVNFLDSKLNVFEYLNLEIDINNLRTVDFNEALSRLKKCFKKYNKKSDEYINVLEGYEFLFENESWNCIRHLSKWRNKIMHNGETLPNIIAYDYFISQQVIPLVNRIFNADKSNYGSYQPHYFKTETNIDLIGEFLKVEISLKDAMEDVKTDKFWFDLFKIFHLKELGRCAFKQIYQGVNVKACEVPQDFKLYKERIKRFTISEKKDPNFVSINTCNCCGMDSLIVYRNDVSHISWVDSDYSYWFKCFNCDYTLKDNVADPFVFGLSKTALFPSSQRI